MKKIGHMLEPFAYKFRPDQSACSKDIAEKQVPAKLKPIVDKVPVIVIREQKNIWLPPKFVLHAPWLSIPSTNHLK